jgi:hypothetical protein
MEIGKPDRIGRVQRQVKRAFIAKGSPLRIGSLLAHCYPRARPLMRAGNATPSTEL